MWGIEDGTHKVVGTSFDPFLKRVGNQEFEFWLRRILSPAPALNIRSVKHPDGNDVLLEIPAATMVPAGFEGVQYIRIGSATPKLSDDPGQYQALMEKIEPYALEQGIALGYLLSGDVLLLLDYPSYVAHIRQQLSASRDRILEWLRGDQLIQEGCRRSLEHYEPRCHPVRH